jgi:hypothetical protein
LRPVILDELADTVATFAGAFGSFDAQHVEFALDVAKDEISALRHKCGHQSLSRAIRLAVLIHPK